MAAFDALEEFPPAGVTYPRRLDLRPLKATSDLGNSILDAFSIPRPTDRREPFRIDRATFTLNMTLVTAGATIGLLHKFCDIVGLEVFAFSLYHHQKSRSFDVPKQMIALSATFVSHAVQLEVYWSDLR